MNTFRPYISGLATGVVTMCVVCAVYDPRTLDVLKDNAVQIITIFATLGAAAVAYAGIMRQIGHQAALEEKRRQQELEAVRAVLPLALSRICEISKRGMQETIGIFEIASEDVEKKRARA